MNLLNVFDTRENRLCRKCVKTGTNNGMYGTHRIGKLNPNFGKNWTGEKKTEYGKYQKPHSSNENLTVI